MCEVRQNSEWPRDPSFNPGASSLSLTTEQQSALLFAVFARSPNPMAFFDGELIVRAANEAWAKVMRPTLGELIGLSVKELFADPNGRLESVFQEVRERRKLSSAEIHLPQPETLGFEPKSLRLVVSPVSGPENTLAGYLASIQEANTTALQAADCGEANCISGFCPDIGKRKRAEEALRDERQRFFSLLDQLPAFAYLQAPDHSIRFANLRFKEIFGDPNGRSCHEIFHEREKPCENCKATPVFETKNPRQSDDRPVNGRVYQVYDYPFADVDGDSLFFELGIDVTERRRAEEELQRLVKDIDTQRHLFSSVIEIAPVSIIVLRGPDFVCEVANQATQSFVPAKPMLGRPFFEVWPELAAQARPVFREVLSTGKPWRGVDVPLKVRRKPDGDLEEVYLTLGIVPLSEPDGDDQSLVVAALETTEQVLNRKKLEELDRQKNEFLSLVAHELRTPLTALKGYAQTAMRRLLAVEGRDREVKALQIVNAQADRMANLVNELLDISRIEQGRLELRLAKLDLGKLSQDVTNLLQVTTERHRLRLTVDGVIEAVGDQGRIEQVLFNLLHNAIKYSPQGGVIEVDVAKQDDQACVQVRDYGIGIAPDKQPHLFNRFYQAHDGNHAFSGLGLGLYISHEIVTRLGGKMWLESAQEKGSTFCFSLPLA